jgi:hypothetical protein
MSADDWFEKLIWIVILSSFLLIMVGLVFFRGMIIMIIGLATAIPIIASIGYFFFHKSQ